MKNDVREYGYTRVCGNGAEAVRVFYDLEIYGTI